MASQNAQVQGALTLAAAQKLLTRPNKFQWLNSLNQFAANAISTVEIMNNKLNIPMFPCDTGDGKVTSMVLPPVDLSIQISGIAKVGNNLVITLAEPKGEYFRFNFTALNDNGTKKGIVIGRSPSTVTLAPLAGQTLATTDFEQGGYLNEGTQLVPNRASDKVDGREIMPDLVYDLLPIYRANRFFARRDYSTSNFVQEVMIAAKNGDYAGVEAGLVKLQLNDMSYDLMKQMEKDFVFGEYGVQTIDNQAANTPRGFLQAVRDRGGFANDTSTVITFQKHIDTVQQFFQSYNGMAQEVICLAGAGYMSRVQTGGQSYKLTAGKNSILEGSGIGFTTVESIFGNITYVPLSLFNDPNSFKGLGSQGTRRLSESCLYITVTKMKDYNGNVVSPIQKYYGSYGGNTSGIKLTATNGIVDGNGKFVMNSPSQIDGSVLGQVCEETHVIPNAQPLGYYMVD
jgi:hypothetical protein